jgi:hypothetical protein
MAKRMGAELTRSCSRAAPDSLTRGPRAVYRGAGADL